MPTWMKLETLVRSNPKLVATIAQTGHGDAAWLWLCGNLYCRDILTDGFIADAILPTLMPGLPPRALKPLPAVLVAAGLWHREDGGYRIHDFLHFNPTKAEIEDRRRADRDRKRSGIQTDSGRNPNGVQEDSIATRTRGTPAGASSLSSSGSPVFAETTEVVPAPPAPTRVRHYGDHHGVRSAFMASALVPLGEGRTLEIHESWAKKTRDAYKLSHADIDAFAKWLGAKLQAAGGVVDDIDPKTGKPNRFGWLDEQNAEWRRTRRSDASASTLAAETDKFLEERRRGMANLAPVEDVLKEFRRRG